MESKLQPGESAVTSELAVTRKKTFYSAYAKRWIDFVLSALALIVLSWLYLLVYIAIKIDDPGSALFWQKRVGKKKDGQITYFMLAKFRSMKMSTPHNVPTHMLENPDQYITRAGVSCESLLLTSFHRSPTSSPGR
jgi:O-antigen biosynthesis protein WbqP